MDSDRFDDVGGRRMSDEEMDAFLHEQGVGVLSLASDGDAYGVPMSYGYDDEARAIYFAYLRPGERSEKEVFSADTDRASFLVFEVERRDRWRSVVARGPIRPTDEAEWESASAALGADAWYPDVFRESSTTRGIAGYVLSVQGLTGRKGGDL